MMQIPREMEQESKQESFSSREVATQRKRHSAKTKQIKKIETPPIIETKLQNNDGQHGNSKISAKEVKRLRQQNRRANHKEYVTRIEAELQEKNEEVVILSQKIKRLTEKLENLSYSRYCSKCKAELCETSAVNISHQQPDVQEKVYAYSQNLQSEMEIELELRDREDFFDSDFIERVRNDEGSLAVNFGSNFLFIFITFCCLSANCIADNAELFLEPIMPYRLKSEMSYLPTPSNLNKVEILSPLEKFLRTPGYQLLRNQCWPLELEEEISAVSTSLKIDFNFSFQFPNLEEVKNWILNSREGLASLSANFISRNFINAHNYYV